jgi:hypothetical protein
MSAPIREETFMRSTIERAVGICPIVENLEGRIFLSGDPVLEWNAVALAAVADDFTPWEVPSPDQRGPTRTARAMAIVHAAMFDAFNSIDNAYTPYTIYLKGYDDASPDAAVAQAAHDTLAAMYPQQKADFDKALKSSLKHVPDGETEREGVELGSRIAKATLRARKNDGADNSAAYDEPDEPGVFQPFPDEPDPLDPNWGGVTPFTIKSAKQFRADPPPAMTSDAYWAAYDEVKNYGGDGVTTPTLRTAEQTEIGMYWGYDGAPGIGTPPRLYNQIARVIAKQQHNTPAQNARMFALINLAMADAGIASWDTKYTYCLWRPIRGIRQVDAQNNPRDDGNPHTDADPNWTPMGAQYTNGPAGSQNFTPPFPAYTSGHATFGGALFTMLARFYGTDDIGFTFTSDELNGKNAGVDGVIRPLSPRSFTSLSQAMEENAQSRIYLGVHWSFDKTAGMKQGKSVADYAFEHVLLPQAGNQHPSVVWNAGEVTTLASAGRALDQLEPMTDPLSAM